MDTIVFVITMIGASLVIALLFASTVLSYKWRNLPLFHRRHTSKDSQQKRQGSNSELIPQHKVVEVKSQSQSPTPKLGFSYGPSLSAIKRILNDKKIEVRKQTQNRNE